MRKIYHNSGDGGREYSKLDIADSRVFGVNPGCLSFLVKDAAGRPSRNVVLDTAQLLDLRAEINEVLAGVDYVLPMIETIEGEL